MKCVSYDYDFESDLTTKWKALDRAAPQPSAGTKRRWRKRQLSLTEDSEDEDEAPTRRSRDHLLRNVRRSKRAPHEDSVSVVVSGSEGSLGEDEEDLYHDADVGDFPEC